MPPIQCSSPSEGEPATDATVRKRKVRNGHAPYKPRAPKEGKATKDHPLSSAGPATGKSKRKNLTTHDWLTVFAYIDAHPNEAQDKIVNHFRTRPEGPLLFDQSTLSRRLSKRTELEEHSKAYPNAPSQKRPRVVTRPDVEKSLFLWVKHMEEKRETVTGDMLVAKRAIFEQLLSVPEEECLSGNGWIPSFKKAYGIKEYQRHAEADSVEVIELEEEEEEEDGVEKVSLRDAITMCEHLERACIQYGTPDMALDLARQLRQFRGLLRRTTLTASNAVQSTLDQWPL